MEAAALPSLYARWIDDVLRAPIQSEPKAACHECPMCRDAGSALQHARFQAETKCCTYHPDIPNFLAGAILADDDEQSAEGHERLRRRINDDANAWPQGIYPTLAESAKYSALSPGFGSDASMLCPYYIAETGGLCGIWKHRNSRCATWFCKHERGLIGREFWRTLKELLTAVEQYLSLWCIHRFGAGDSAFRELFSLDIAPDLSRFQQRQQFLHHAALPADWISDVDLAVLKQQIWGQWLGHEEAFYRQCAGAVAQLDWDHIVAFNDPTILNHVARLRHAYASTNDRALMTVLRQGNFEFVPVNDEVVRIWGYSQYDPIDVPAFVPGILKYFDGRATDDVLEWIQTNTRFVVSRELIQTLSDFGILKE